MALHENIRARRTQLKLSQEYVAEKLGVSRQAVAKWEAGKSEPTAANLARLAALFEMNVSELAATPAPPDAAVQKRATPGGITPVCWRGAGRRTSYERGLGRAIPPAFMPAYARPSSYFCARRPGSAVSHIAGHAKKMETAKASARRGGCSAFFHLFSAASSLCGQQGCVIFWQTLQPPCAPVCSA